MNEQIRIPRFAVCIKTHDSDVLTLRMVYRVVGSPLFDITTINNEGKCASYPLDHFVLIDLSYSMGSQVLSVIQKDSYKESLHRIKELRRIYVLENYRGRSLRDVEVSLDLGHLDMDVLPPEFEQLTDSDVLTTHLGVLDFSDNQLTSIPPEIAQFRHLRRLLLRKNQLTIISLEIMQLTELRTLDLSHNQLTSIPPEIAQLSNLKRLDIGCNQLTTIPLELAQLTNLERLYIYHNQLTEIPSILTQLPKLKLVFLKGNPNLTISSETIAQWKDRGIRVDLD